jgi:Tol biopolymer transport system component
MDKVLLRQGARMGSLAWILVPLIVGASAISAVAGPTTQVSVNSAGEEGNAPSQASSLSATGRFVAFSSIASNLVPGDTNGVTDVFVHDRKTGVTTRVSVDSAGGEGNGDSAGPSISASGRFVAFTSAASNLVPGDTNGTEDVRRWSRPARDTGRDERPVRRAGGARAPAHDRFSGPA